MASLPSFVRLLLLAIFVHGAGSAVAQDELRKTFFKDVDAARAAADAVNSYLLAPRSYSAAVKDYQGRSRREKLQDRDHCRTVGEDRAVASNEESPGRCQCEIAPVGT